MGIFDLFRDGDDYAGSHSVGRGDRQPLDASLLRTPADRKKWLQAHRVIVVSEDGGLTVFTDDAKKNFIQIYAELPDRQLRNGEELAEISFAELRALLGELGDIDYLVLNPDNEEIRVATSELIEEKASEDDDFPVRRRHGLDDSHAGSTDLRDLRDSVNSTEEKKAPDSAVSEDEDFPEIVVAVPQEKEDEASQSASAFSSDSDEVATRLSQVSESSVSEKQMSNERAEIKVPVIFETSERLPEIIENSEQESQGEAKKMQEEENSQNLSEQESSASQPIVQEIEIGSRDQNTQNTRNYSGERAFEGSFSRVQRMPSSLIKSLTAFLDKTPEVHKLYMAEKVVAGKHTYGFFADGEGSIDNTDLKMATDSPDMDFVNKENESLAAIFRKEEFLIYDELSSKNLKAKRTALEDLRYIETHPLFYPYSENEGELGADELITFTNFTQIPVQFLLAFTSFSISPLSEVVDQLEDNRLLERVHINPFTDGVIVSADAVIARDSRKKNVLIIGMGMIGGSIAAAIKRGGTLSRVYGSDNEEVLDTAMSRKFLFRKVTDVGENAKYMDFIILATPVEETKRLIKQLAGYELREGVIITDTGSTKAEIVAAADEAFADKPIHFVGGHPMAGSHKSGPLAATETLFENAYYVLSEECVPLTDLLAGLGAKFIVVDASEHDVIVSQVSHFPHILASNLVLQSSIYASEHPLVNNLAAGGFRDMTRIVESDITMWTSVLMTNTDNILNRIQDFKAQLDNVAAIIQSRDEDEIRKFFTVSKQVRKEMEIHKGALQPFYDLFVSIPDKKGAVLEVLTVLEDFSITNIKINEENREEINGVLQISFASAGDQEEARDIIKRRTKYEVSGD